LEEKSGLLDDKELVGYEDMVKHGPLAVGAALINDPGGSERGCGFAEMKHLLENEELVKDKSMVEIGNE
jgi:hypothetical protein